MWAIVTTLLVQKISDGAYVMESGQIQTIARSGDALGSMV